MRSSGIPIGGNGRGDGAEDGRILGGCGGCTPAGGGAAARATGRERVVVVVVVDLWRWMEHQWLKESGDFLGESA